MSNTSRGGGRFELERTIGVGNGISVEIWRDIGEDRLSLVVWPSVEGFMTVGDGKGQDVGMLGVIGQAVFNAIEAVAPLLTGSHFRAHGGRMSQDVYSAELLDLIG